jgi:hypothetical protein
MSDDWKRFIIGMALVAALFVVYKCVDARECHTDMECVTMHGGEI